MLRLRWKHKSNRIDVGILRLGYSIHYNQEMDVAQFLIDLIFQPGSSLRLVPAINVTVLLLIGLLILAGMYSEIAKIHFFIMSFLALGLLLSVNW